MIRKIFSVLAGALFVAAICFGQAAPAPKSHTFRGKVEAVDPTAQSLRVNGEKVDGWMDAMTMNYKVDDASVLKKVKPGDQIMATVYNGDLVLHQIHVMGKTGSPSKK